MSEERPDGTDELPWSAEKQRWRTRGGEEVTSDANLPFPITSVRIHRKQVAHSDLIDYWVNSRGVALYWADRSPIHSVWNIAKEWSEPNDASSSSNPVVTKVSILEEAIATVRGRGKSYGTPEDNFARIAEHWTAYLKNRKPSTAGPHFISPFDVAYMMILMKIARLENDPRHHDSIVDIAGYAACAGEIAGIGPNA